MDELAEQLRDLATRVARLEAAAAPARETPFAPEIVDRLSGGSGPDTVSYSGAGEWGEDTLVWQRRHEWGELRQRVDDGVARVFAALGNPVRLRIVARLLAGPATTAELTEHLAQPSSGQLFHHIKDLLTAGLVHQPVRGTYALRRQDVIPLLAALAVGNDLAASGGVQEAP